MSACLKCGSVDAPPQWTLFVRLRPPSQNENVDRAGGGRFTFMKLREQWVRAIRHAMEDTGRGRFEPVPRATGRRRVVMTRVFSGRERERDYGNLVGGMKLVVDAMRPPKQVAIKSGKRKGQVVTVDGAGLIVDDSPTWLDDVYLQEHSTIGLSGLRIAVTDLGPAPGHVDVSPPSAMLFGVDEEATAT